jgi:hypothetical protein
VIHTDFERGFIRAQTIAFEDFISTRASRRQGRRQDARRRQGIRRQGRRRAELPVQRLIRTSHFRRLHMLARITEIDAGPVDTAFSFQLVACNDI